jgi:hypothetical protein
VCEGWGHRCPAFVEAHPEQVEMVAAVYVSGFDPTRYYASTDACLAAETETASRRHIADAGLKGKS